ncbi:MAG: DUF3822 family protein [Bacteroidota bacterium]
MHDLTIFDETFDINNTVNYNLSIQILPDCFTCSIFDTIRNKFIGLKHFYFGKDIPQDSYNEIISNILKGEEILIRRYKSIKILMFSNRFTIIPSALFQENSKELYFQFNNVADPEILITNQYKNIDAHIIFGVNDSLKKTIDSFFNNAQFFHQSVPLVYENLMINKNKLSSPKVFVNLNSVYYDLAVLVNNNLELFNCFKYTNNEDFMYFLMYVYEHLKLDPENIPITISGDIERKSELVTHIEQFIKNVNFSLFPRSFMFSYHYKQLDEHVFSNLFYLEKCG